MVRRVHHADCRVQQGPLRKHHHDEVHRQGDQYHGEGHHEGDQQSLGGDLDRHGEEELHCGGGCDGEQDGRIHSRRVLRGGLHKD